MRDRRGARSLNILFCRLPIFDADKKTHVHLIAKGMVKEFRCRRGLNFLRCVKDGSRDVCSFGYAPFGANACFFQWYIMINSRRHRRICEIRRAGIHPTFGTNPPRIDINSTG